MKYSVLYIVITSQADFYDVLILLSFIWLEIFFLFV